MYYLNKVVGWCLSPLGIVFFGFLVGWLSRRYGSEGGRFRRKLCAVGRHVPAAVLVMLWIFGSSITVRLVGVLLEGAEIDEASLPSAEAIVVLGGGVSVHEECGRVELCSAADRVWTGARLYRLGKAPQVIVSEGPVSGVGAFLHDLGVGDEAVLNLAGARNTEEEAALIAERGIRRILLVTSAWHMPRARMLFERRGLEVIPAPTDYEMTAVSEAKVTFMDFFPTADGLRWNAYAVKEWVGRLGYAVIRR